MVGGPPRSGAMLLAAAWIAFSPGPALALPRDPDAWIRVESRSFTLFSDASESATLEIAARLETFRAVLARLHPGLEVSSPLPTFIYVFKSDDAFTPYKK